MTLHDIELNTLEFSGISEAKKRLREWRYITLVLSASELQPNALFSYVYIYLDIAGLPSAIYATTRIQWAKWRF